MVSTSQAQTEEFTLTTEDGYSLVSTRYACEATSPPKACVIIASATGVPQRYYRHFAAYLAKRQIECWTLDYRGIGKSRPKSLRGFEASMITWARLDLSALIDFVSDRCDAPLSLVGHSFGGQTLGLLPNANKIHRCLTFGTGAGWTGWMPFSERLKVYSFWWFFGPLLCLQSGYLSWSRLKLGEDLPLGVFKQWKRWCQFPHYFFDDPDMAEQIQGFGHLDIPIFAINSVDDRWAPPASRDAFFSELQRAPVETLDLVPGHYRQNRIGHLGYFYPKLEQLWAEVCEWLLAEA